MYNKPAYKEAKRNLTKVSEERNWYLWVISVVKKKKDMIVSASEEKKHKKQVQKLKDEESVSYYIWAIIS